MSSVTNTNDEVIRRNLDKLRREMGEDIRNAMDDNSVIEIMLNPDGKVWTDKIGAGMQFLCHMSPVQSLQMLGTVAHMPGTVINYHNPKVEGVIPPIVPNPSFNIMKKASAVFSLEEYVKSSHASNQDIHILREAITARKNILVIVEVRRKEASDMLKAWDTGYPGRVCTVHAKDARAGLFRIEQLISEISKSSMRKLIAEAINAHQRLAYRP